MKKNNYLLLMLLVVVFALVFIFVFKNWYKEKWDIKDNSIPLWTPSNVVFPTEEPIIDNQENSATWTNDEVQYIEKKEIEDLEIKQEAEIKQKEIDIISLNSAGETGKKELCDDIVDPELKAKCIDNSYAAKASLHNNPDLCKIITDIAWRNNCLDDYYNKNALKTQDYNLCKKIINTNLRENCISSIIFQKIESTDFKWWIEICSELNKESKINCEKRFTTQNDVEILQKAIISLDINSCKKIIKIELKNKCRDVINFKLALNLKDINKCYLITEWDLKTKCTTVLNNINK